MKLETERLLLRELAPEDFDALYAVLAGSDIMQHYPYTFDEKHGARTRVRLRAGGSLSEGDWRYDR